MTSAETIREITRKHLTEDNGVLLGQCLTAVGWVGGTVPELPGHKNLIELSTDDTSGAGLTVGYALAGRRPIFICRYQGFMWFDSPFLANYAAKAKELWKYSCPIFIRSIAMDGFIGPVSGSSHHGMMTRVPGMAVYAPMTPGEYRIAWDYFINHDGPLYVSEHRRSFVVDYEMPDIITDNADITILPISAARIDALKAKELLEKEGISCNIVNITWLKPFNPINAIISAIEDSTHGGIVIDTDFENGISKCIAHDLMMKTDSKIRVLGLEERTAGFAPHLDNLSPSPDKIAGRIREIIRRERT